MGFDGRWSLGLLRTVGRFAQPLQHVAEDTVRVGYPDRTFRDPKHHPNASCDRRAGSLYCQYHAGGRLLCVGESATEPFRPSLAGSRTDYLSRRRKSHSITDKHEQSQFQQLSEPLYRVCFVQQSAGRYSRIVWQYQFAGSSVSGVIKQDNSLRRHPAGSSLQ